MTEEEFSRRFTNSIVRIAVQNDRRPFDRDPEQYAVGVVQSYWREFLSHGGTPEYYAQEDAHHWGD